MTDSLNFSLATEQRRTLASLLSRAGDAYADQNAAALVARKALYTTLDLARLRMLDRFRGDPEAPQLLFVDGLPVDPSYPTPTDDRLPDKRTHVGEHVTLGLGALLGEAVGYLSEKQGSLLHNIVPIRSGETLQSNQSSAAPLRFHNDTVYDESLVYNRHNPDFLVLYCVRQDPDGEAETVGVDAREILAHLNASERRRAFVAPFRMASPANWSKYLSATGVVWSCPQPLFTGSVRSPEICLAANGMRAVNPADESLLERVYEICARPDVQVRVRLAPGQALLVNNRKGVHARSSFRAGYDGKDRWLLRANVRSATWTMRDGVVDPERYKVFA